MSAQCRHVFACGSQPRAAPARAGEEPAEDLGPLLRGVRFAALDAHQEGVLWDVCPAFVIMYDPDVAFIRQLEVQCF